MSRDSCGWIGHLAPASAVGFALGMRLVPARGGGEDVAATRVELYGVVSRSSGEVIGVFTTRADAEKLVATWDADEPDDAGALDVVELVIDCSLN
jgi:hypothetical protein